MNEQKNIKILVIEDDHVFSTLIVRKLKSLGYKAQGLSSGQDAMDAIKEKSYHLLILDYKLPEYTAKDFIMILHQMKLNLPFIVMTGYTDVYMAVEMMKLGAWDYIVKDANFMELLPPVVENCIRKLNVETKLHATEESLQKTNEFLNSVILASPLAIISFDKDLKITSWSQAAEKIFNYTFKETENLTINSFCSFNLNNKNSFIADFHNILLGWKITSVDIKGIKKDGSTFDCHLSSAPIKNAIGEIIGGMCIIDDITERKKIETALKDSEERYRLLAENATDVIWTTDISLNLTFITNSVERYLGFLPSEMINRKIEEWFAPPYTLKTIKKMKSFLKSHNAKTNKDLQCFEVEYLKADGTTIWGEVTINILLNSESQIIGLVGVTRDISERKIIENEKQKLQNQIFQSHKMEAIGVLAGGIAHDFNNLLTTIQGNADLAIAKLNPIDPIYKRLQQIHEPITKASQLTRQLLLFGRRQPLEKKMINLNNITLNIIKMLRRLIGEDISIAYEFHENIWTVFADTTNIEQVIMNIALNARDAMHNGGKLIIKTENIELKDEKKAIFENLKPGKFICISFTDNGIGMSKEVIEHIFEPFFTTKSPGMGTGLGLSVVYGIIKKHDGFIKVESEPGYGSCFKIYLPSVPFSPDESISIDISQDDLKGNGESILLIEDEISVLNFFEQVFTENGYLVFTAMNASQAMDIINTEKNNIDVILSDVVLPDKDGLSIAEEILEKNKKISLILTSGYPDAKGKIESIRKKKITFLQKPYSIFQMLSTVKKMLKKNQSINI